MSKSKTIVLITGANQGIGYEAARLFASSSQDTYHAIIGSRSLSRGQEAVSRLSTSCSPDSLSTVQLDVTDPASIASAVGEVQKLHGRLDALVNNAAIVADPTSILPAVDALGHKYNPDHANLKLPSMAEQLRRALDTNTIGAADVTEQFLPLLRKSSQPKIVFVSSGVGSFSSAADPTTAPSAVAYRVSKAALNMLMVQWNKLLGKEGMKLWGVCPGFCATNLGGDSIEKFKEAGARDPSLGAQVIVDVVEGKREADVGRVVFDEGVRAW